MSKAFYNNKSQKSQILKLNKQNNIQMNTKFIKTVTKKIEFYSVEILQTKKII